MKPFSKPAIDMPAQLTQLKQRGLAIQNEGKAHSFLEAVSFFRLPPYMHSFQPSEDAGHGFSPPFSEPNSPAYSAHAPINQFETQP